MRRESRPLRVGQVGEVAASRPVQAPWSTAEQGAAYQADDVPHTLSALDPQRWSYAQALPRLLRWPAVAEASGSRREAVLPMTSKQVRTTLQASGAAEHASLRLAPCVGGEITLRRLQIFWAIAHTTSLTKAAKLLGVSQPSLSQQLGSLETTIGAKLFDRQANAMALTEFGASILGRAENVLRSLQEFEDELPRAGRSLRQTIRIAGVTSVMRAVLPGALRALREAWPLVDFDMIEAAPAEILDLLYGRRIGLGLLPANAVAEASAGFHQHLLLEDPYVLVVPTSLELSKVDDPDRDLSAAELELLNSTVQFAFGNQHSRRIQDWYDGVLPRNRLVAQARSFEMAIEMVRSGFGVCVAPALSALSGAELLGGVRLYRTGIEPRRIVAMLPSHHGAQGPHADLLAALREATAGLRIPAVGAIPPFIASGTTDKPSLSRA